MGARESGVQGHSLLLTGVRLALARRPVLKEQKQKPTLCKNIHLQILKICIKVSVKNLKKKNFLTLNYLEFGFCTCMCVYMYVNIRTQFDLYLRGPLFFQALDGPSVPC